MDNVDRGPIIYSVTCLAIVGIATIATFLRKPKAEEPLPPYNYVSDHNSQGLLVTKKCYEVGNEDWVEEVRREMLDDMKVGCLCKDPSCSQFGHPCFKCGKPCTYQPTVNGRPLYRCEWRVLQHGSHGADERNFRQQLSWFWTCSVCGMEPLYQPK